MERNKFKPELWNKAIERKLLEHILMPKIYQGKTIEEACEETNTDINEVKRVFNIKEEQNSIK